MQVEDVMGLTTTNRPVDDWSLFHVTGRRTNELLIWPTVANRLTGTGALDEVILGIDEDANLMWAIERRVDGTELTEPDEPLADDAPTGPIDQVVVTGVRRYRYLPATAVPHLWHPYVLSTVAGARRFVQGRLADLGARPVLRARPGRRADCFATPAPEPPTPCTRSFPPPSRGQECGSTGDTFSGVVPMANLCCGFNGCEPGSPRPPRPPCGSTSSRRYRRPARHRTLPRGEEWIDEPRPRRSPPATGPRRRCRAHRRDDRRARLRDRPSITDASCPMPMPWMRCPGSTSRCRSSVSTLHSRSTCCTPWAARRPSPRPVAATSVSSLAPPFRRRSPARGSPAHGINAALPVMSPIAAKLHDVVTGWLVDLLRLPVGTGVAFVSGATVANASCLAAARDALLTDLGWDVQSDGLFGAPEFHVVVGERPTPRCRNRSASSVSVGIGSSPYRRTIRAACGPTSFRTSVVRSWSVRRRARSTPERSIPSWTSPTGSPSRSGWLHVDGAFGLWALTDPGRADLVAGLDRADSWATDGHKWLNVTYDCGMAFARRPADLRRTFSAAAGYLPPSTSYEAMHHTPQSSQRARQIEVWSVLKTLGRTGVQDMVVRACAAARLVADRLAAGGVTVLNDVVLNQVLVRSVDGPTTEALIREVQSDGRVWCGSTQWDGATAMRISVSSWKTDLEDASFAADVLLECAARVAP